MLAHFGAVQNPPLWKPLPDDIAEIESILKRLDELREMLRSEQNRLEAQENRPVSNMLIKKNIKDSIHNIEGQIRELEKAVDDYFEAHPKAKEQVKRLKTVP